jgi:pyruvate,water dikinase
MAAVENVSPPTLIYGDQPLPLDTPAEDTLRGTPVSGGRYVGPVRVVAGMRDFDKVRSGDVLVIPYSDAGWTPLFVKAGAVVAESGGMLSHSAIVAREYGIPGVVSVPGACRIQDDAVVTVDGYQGTVSFHERHALVGGRPADHGGGGER